MLWEHTNANAAQWDDFLSSFNSKGECIETINHYKSVYFSEIVF